MSLLINEQPLLSSNEQIVVSIPEITIFSREYSVFYNKINVNLTDSYGF